MSKEIKFRRKLKTFQNYIPCGWQRKDLCHVFRFLKWVISPVFYVHSHTSDLSIADLVRKCYFMQNVGNNIHIPHCFVHVEPIMPWPPYTLIRSVKTMPFEYWASFIPHTNLVAGVKKLFLNLFYILIQKHFQIKHPSDVL